TALHVSEHFYTQMYTIIHHNQHNTDITSILVRYCLLCTPQLLSSRRDQPHCDFGNKWDVAHLSSRVAALVFFSGQSTDVRRTAAEYRRRPQSLLREDRQGERDAAVGGAPWPHHAHPQHPLQAVPVEMGPDVALDPGGGQADNGEGSGAPRPGAREP